MKKKRNLKMLLAGLMFGVALGMPLIQPTTPIQAETGWYINKLGASYEVTITNSKLRNRICELLGKTSSSKLYASDFADCDKFKATKVVDEETGNETWTAETTWLDLSNIGVQDIRELTQFEFPVTLQAIDLSNNNISNSDLKNINAFLDANTENKNIIIDEKEVIIRTDLDTLIKKVNLNFNSIELGSLSDENLNNERLIYGLQNVPDSTLLTKSELTNTKYYIRENENIYMSYNFYFNVFSEEGRITYNENKVTSLADREYGSYKITVSSPPLSETAYFYGYTDTIEYTMFDLVMKPDFTVERLNAFRPGIQDYTLHGIGYSDGIIEWISYDTHKAGTAYVAVIIHYNGVNKSISVPFTVVDTIKPIIKLKGYETMYWRQNRDWVDPGCTGYDPMIANDVSGEPLTPEVDDSTLDVTKIGTYTITYTLKDLSGNYANPVTRTVIVQEQVLDEINISTAKKDYANGEEVILTVTPNENTSMEKYTDFEYTWYLDGRAFKTTKGDNVTGKSTVSLILDGTQEKIITVKLKAKQVADGRYVYVDSSEFKLKPTLIVSSDTSIIIACTVAVVAILGVILLIYFLKARKSTSKVAKKYKNTTRLQSEQNGTEIQVIRNYTGSPNSNGGKENEHTKSDSDKDNDQVK